VGVLTGPAEPRLAEAIIAEAGGGADLSRTSVLDIATVAPARRSASATTPAPHIWSRPRARLP
jgi:hypothetical protein